MGESSTNRSRIGVFGGTFDPPHVAHVQIAQFLLDFGRLESVLWIPAATPPHKSDYGITPANIRLRMVSAAIKGITGQEVSDIEILRGGYSYTVETLRALKQIYPEKDLLLIMGSDQFLSLYKWREVESLTGLAEICVLPRRGDTDLSERLPSKVCVDWMLAPFGEVDVSSSEIRKNIQQDLPYRHLVSRSVREIIVEEGLYQT
ncbi:MAG TPA: nicotinate (nicotinamide) nucleotide adenylyltransferase [Gemmatimonadetes bacterium]|nr:nicotinate (nicotinamide) nucleotide adenylyltransferase [Gemmatimonadota bacterium]